MVKKLLLLLKGLAPGSSCSGVAFFLGGGRLSSFSFSEKLGTTQSLNSGCFQVRELSGLD